MATRERWKRRAIDVLLYEPVTDLNSVTVSRLVRGGISYCESYYCENRSAARRVALYTLLSTPIRLAAAMLNDQGIDRQSRNRVTRTF